MSLGYFPKTLYKIINYVNIIINVKKNLNKKAYFYIRFDAIIIMLIMQKYKININK